MDPYALLGLEPGASAEEIKKAWRKAARDHHPDRNPDDPQAEARFKEIQAAHEELQRRLANPQPQEPHWGGRWKAPPPPDDDWLATVQWMAEHRRTHLFEQVLPRYVAAYGAGHLLAFELSEALQRGDLEANAPEQEANWLARLRSQRALRGVDVGLTDTQLSRQILTVRPRSGGARALIHGRVLHMQGLAEDELRRVVFQAVDVGICSAFSVARKRHATGTRDQAIASDRGHLFWTGVWVFVALLSAFLIGGAILSGQN